jgi:ABC-type bacteriocin/lantibiotic exporter with double-glycine peptidase domain
MNKFEIYKLTKKCLRVLPESDIRKYTLVVAIQVLLGLLDLVGIFLFGLLGSLTIRGISYQKPGDRVSQVLQLVGIENSNLRTQVTIVGLAATAALIIKSILSLSLGKKTLYFLSRRSAILSSNLISKLFSKDITVVQRDSISSLIYNLTSGVEGITTGILGSIALLIADISLLLILSAGLLLVDPALAVVSVFYFATLGYILYRKMHIKYRQLGEQVTNLTIEGNQKISEIISSYREVLVRNRRQFYSRIIGEARLRTSNANAEIGYMGNFSKYLMELFMISGALGIAAFEFLTQPPSRAIGIISIFLATSSRIAPGILRLQQGILGIKNKAGTAQTTLDLIDSLHDSEIEDITDSGLDFEHIGFVGSLELSNVDYQYPAAEKKALNNINLKINEGKFIAIVGPSGSGKSTLVDLILGVLHPTNGEIRISSLSPKEVINKWPGALGYVPQNVVINQGTIKSNICLGYSPVEVKDSSIYSAIAKAQLTDLINELPLSLETKIEDRGTNLSGGQKQRLGIARALFTNPKFLILDEATSALDALTEHKITDSISELYGKVTVIVVAHRLSTVVKADDVIYLSDGRVMAQGSFAEVRSKIPDFDRQAKLMGL